MVSYRNMSDKEIKEYQQKSIEYEKEKLKIWKEHRKIANNNGNTKDIYYCDTSLFKK